MEFDIYSRMEKEEDRARRGGEEWIRIMIEEGKILYNEMEMENINCGRRGRRRREKRRENWDRGYVGADGLRFSQHF